MPNAEKILFVQRFSAITQTAARASELVRCPAALEIKDGGLYLMLEKTVKGSKLQQAELILGTMLLGLRSVEQDYSDYLKLTEREV